MNAILDRTALRAGTPEFGDIFEQFIILEVKAFVSYYGHKISLHYWRSTSKFEVDLLLTKHQNQMTAIEIKATSNISSQDTALKLSLFFNF